MLAVLLRIMSHSRDAARPTRSKGRNGDLRTVVLVVTVSSVAGG